MDTDMGDSPNINWQAGCGNHQPFLSKNMLSFPEGLWDSLIGSWNEVWKYVFLEVASGNQNPHMYFLDTYI